jgi:hypothetical protein
MPVFSFAWNVDDAMFHGGRSREEVRAVASEPEARAEAL